MCSLKNNTRKRYVIVGMSGGVDSSVSAALLLEKGYTVEGLFMKNWEEDDGTEYCSAVSDLKDARSVCDALGIKLHVVNFSSDYWDRVFKEFLLEYSLGRTPNPDILCNSEIKFKTFLDYALMLGANFIATGHYVRKCKLNGTDILLKGVDSDKDQSYFLHSLSSKQISRAIFPLGLLKKGEVRSIAEKYSFVNATKKDSTGICFIGKRCFRDFLKRYLPEQPGDILTTEGEIVGTHSGLMYYTIGQRQGIGIGGLKNFQGEPWYVLSKDTKKNQLIIGAGSQHPKLFSKTIFLKKIHWINYTVAQSCIHLSAKIRYRQDDQSCSLEKIDRDTCLKGYLVRFDIPQRAVTPGQSIVFYSADVCLGGGIIESSD